jgi:hypothetical protein
MIYITAHSAHRGENKVEKIQVQISLHLQFVNQTSKALHNTFYSNYMELSPV